MIWWLKSAFDIAGALAEAYEVRQRATTEREKALASERIKWLEARRDVILQGQRDRLEKWVRLCFAFPFVIYVNKLIIWDKVLSLGSTDPLSSDLDHILAMVLGGYFIDSIIRTVAKR